MKKILITSLIFFAFQSIVLADEIIDSKGQIIPCKIETVMDGFIEYKKDGSINYFAREKYQPIFNDYVDVRTKLNKKDSIQRYSGKIIVKDFGGVRIRNEHGDINIPWYRVKFIGIYKP